MNNKIQVMSTHQYAFRCGQWADIVGMEIVKERACYKVRFEDGKEDLTPVNDTANPLEFREKPERDMETDCKAAFEQSGHSEHHDVPFEDGFCRGVAWAAGGVTTVTQRPEEGRQVQGRRRLLRDLKKGDKFKVDYEYTVIEPDDIKCGLVHCKDADGGILDLMVELPVEIEDANR